MTVIPGEGGYSGKKQSILYTVTSLRDLPHLKKKITDLDANAFVVVADTMEVVGNRMGNQPHW